MPASAAVLTVTRPGGERSISASCHPAILPGLIRQRQRRDAAEFISVGEQLKCLFGPVPVPVISGNDRMGGGTKAAPTAN